MIRKYMLIGIVRIENPKVYNKLSKNSHAPSTSFAQGNVIPKDGRIKITPSRKTAPPLPESRAAEEVRRAGSAN